MMIYHRKASKIGKEQSVWYGLSGEINGYSYNLQNVQLGDVRIRHTDAILINPNQYSRAGLPSNRSGVIGGALLKNYTVIFDYGGAALYLKPANKETPKGSPKGHTS